MSQSHIAIYVGIPNAIRSDPFVMKTFWTALKLNNVYDLVMDDENDVVDMKSVMIVIYDVWFILRVF